MLCPEVWNFSAPHSLFKIESGRLDNNNCSATIKNLYYNHLVSVVLPDTLRTPEIFNEILSVDCEYYKILDLSIEELVNKDFIGNFIKKGTFIGLSTNTKIDCDDCACITPNGLIILSLTKDTYQILGLEGSVSHFNQNTKDRYIVHVDLLKDCFKPGKKNYERTKRCLGKLKKFNLLIHWEPPNEEICPSSVAKYFHDLNYSVKVCAPESTVRTDYSVKVPNFDINHTDGDEFVEWLGAFSLQANIDGSESDYISTYEVPSPFTEYGQVKFLQWRGFFTREKIFNLLEALKNWMTLEEKAFVTLYVQSFSDCPVNWNTSENHYFINSDNAYVIVMNSKDYMLCKQMSSNRYYSKNK